MTELPDLDAIRDWPTGRVGYVAIVGRPNVGKSTFLNAVLNFHLAAVSSKPQTTRQNCQGILSTEDSQVIFVDTPGAHEGDTALGEAMLKAVRRSLDDADLILVLADPTRSPGAEDNLIATRAAEAGKPVFLLLNKQDLADDKQVGDTREFYLGTLDSDTRVFHTVATDKSTLDPVVEEIRAALPEGPFFYEPDKLTETYIRDIGAEIIRESLMELLHEEVPHACHVDIDRWKEDGDRLDVDATINVERDTQKGIVVGRGGGMIRKIRNEACLRLAELVADGPDAPRPFVKLKLYVKVSKNWRNKTRFLKDRDLL